MYSLQPSKQYAKGFKRLSRSGRFDCHALNEVLNALAAGESLPARYDNHPLQGIYADCFECHIKSDLLLIYKVEETEGKIALLKIGSHSELFR